MVDNPTGGKGVITFDVGYDGGLGGDSNAELKGRGRLEIDSLGPVYSFTGTRRRLFSSERITVEFGGRDIFNVMRDGRTVRFVGRPRSPDGGGRPWVIHCRDEAEAAAITQLLPAHQLHGFVEARDFLHRLDAISGNRPVWATVTGAIIGLNVVVFVIMAGFLGAGWITPTDLTAYIKYGANNGAATTDGEWWRLVTHLFLHYGILHIALNMWALFNTGRFLEKLMGRVLFALTYLGAGLTGGFASILWNGDKVWSAGASGAVFGVIGAIAGFAVRERESIPRSILRSLMSSSLAFAAYNIVFGFSISGIDNAAHLGGLAGGFVLGWILALPVEQEARKRLFAGRLVTGVAIIAAIVATGLAVTPRFDYRIADELALREAMTEFGPREEQAGTALESAVETLRKDGNFNAFLAWIDREPLPFLKEWKSRLEALPLSDQGRTVARRDEVVAILRLRIESFEHLAADIRAGRSEAFPNFSAANKEISRRIQALDRTK